jgi:SAM-dependent methyltransferase
LPPADAIVATLALHHVVPGREKRRLIRACAHALRRDGVLVSGDFHPSALPLLAVRERNAWVAHLRRAYAPADTTRLLRAWAREDRYVTLEDEIASLRAAGLEAGAAWRRDGFAVLVGRKGATR